MKRHLPALPRQQAWSGTILLLTCALALAPGPAYAWSLLEKPDPTIERGNELFKQGKYAEALQAYEEAGRAKPDSPQIQFDRGNALFKLGRSDEAKDAYERALAGSDSHLRAHDYYNLGNALAQMNQDDAAVQAYRRALRLDPSDAATRHNLEVVLLRKEHPKQNNKKPSPDGGSDQKNDGGQPDAGPDGGPSDGGASDGGAPDAGGKPDGGQDGGGASDGGAGDAGNQGDGGSPQGDGGQGDGGSSHDGGSPQDGGNPKDGGNGQGQGQQADGGAADAGAPSPDQMAQDQSGPDGGGDEDHKPISQQDAERILDSMRRNEKNLQLWKYKPRGVKRDHDVDKDW